MKNLGIDLRWLRPASLLTFSLGSTSLFAVMSSENFEAECKAKNYYSCARMGQYFEVEKNDLPKALEYYRKSCEGNDPYGCKWVYDALMVLCYEREEKKFCGEMEPKGEYRIIALLKDFNPKYEDAFKGHNLDSAWRVPKAEKLFEKRVIEKNPKLLRVLERERKLGGHDGADAETLFHAIDVLKGKVKWGEFDPADPDCEDDLSQQLKLGPQSL